ncbi:3',5'-cyclic-AMP phosphodiesterase [Halopseudomonas pertucinogena]|uniref:3',5'-cyclic adenosine monophosphate phosphodiesterase CpdA n=1 Tax=Halopseudomonas pertucinogena TaxID=86175 RepID=A0ABQ2CIU8_9GAMM|nr:3',5'-cyclic-AMP phosphodiesterase [Halopseudomonas pertucinogena]GGI91263.1 3',5'-cyclic adenosine monophosphate phosphodiesterase CpdA [Halopseudomonas pertucinogena]
MSDATKYSDSVCLVQLTDSHLFSDTRQSLLGIDTLASLNAVIDLVQEQCPQIDLVLATGDITQDGSTGGYYSFIEAVSRLASPCHWIPGNHDNALLMNELGREKGLVHPWVDVGNWRVVLLDSSVAGEVWGRLDPDQLQQLDEALATVQERHVLVCLHHHPVAIGSDWMEPLGLRNAAELWQRLDRHPQVRGVLWGHIHQQLEQQRGQLRLMASPSTCVQFAVGSSDFATDDLAPGYRWLRLYDDGRMESDIARLPAGSFTPQADASGY